MRSLILILSACIVLSAASCTKNNELEPASDRTPVSKVTVKQTTSTDNGTATLYFTGLDGTTPVYWQNGVEHNLSVSDTDGNGSHSVRGYTYNIAAAGTDVYITGYNGLDYVYWKNGTANIMPYALYAQGVALSGTDVYFAGTSFQDAPPYLYSLSLVKDGNYTAVSRTGNSAHILTTTIAGADVYNAGNDNPPSTTTTTVPVYWKNGVEHFLPVVSSPGYGAVTAIAVSGSDVYFAGQDGQAAVYWKNGVEHILPMNSNVGGVTAMAVSGTDVYLAGTDFRSAVYWKNGVETTLPLSNSGSNNSFVYGMAVDGTDIYIAGWEMSGDPVANNNYNTPEYWKNGTVHTLPVTSASGASVTAMAIAK